MLDSGECFQVCCAATTSAATTKNVTALRYEDLELAMANIKRNSEDEPTWGLYQSDLKRSPNEMLGMR